MGAATYVGRVGGLAVALGVGVAIFVGGGTASADTDATPGNSTSSQRSATDSDGTAETKSRNSIDVRSAERDKDDAESTTRSAYGTSRRDRSAAGTATGDTVESPAHTEDRPAKDDAADSVTAATSRRHSLTQVRTPAASEAPASEDRNRSTNSPAEWVLAAAARRELAADAVTYNPVVALDDGVITGTNTTQPQTGLTYTVVGGPTGGGKVSLDAGNGNFTFLPYLSPTTPVGTERFSVLVAQQTGFTQALQHIPVVSLIAPRILVVLQQVPVLKDLLSPLIGRAERFSIDVDIDDYVGEGRPPIAFTTRLPSFDGTPISVNFFPASGLDVTVGAPTVLNGPSLATAGYIDLAQASTVSGLVPGISQIREAGYNVITWDPRGEFASGGRMHLDSELFEARDVSAIIDWAALQPGVRLETAGDPLVGMVGGSYGGGIQLTSAGTDNRIDAIAPGIAWNSLETALYPNNSFKTSWASLLALSLVVTGARPDPTIYAGILTGLITGFLTPYQQKFLSENSPDTVVGNITAPTLFLQGTVDGLFVLEQALANAEQLSGEVPVRMIWYCGGHGYCLDLSKQQAADQYGYLNAQTLAWMDTYVKYKGQPSPIVPGPTFTWVDQRGNWFAADTLPTQGSDFFAEEVIELSGPGGLLPLIPILGGSGPQTQAPFPLSLPAAAESRHALELEISNQGTTAATPIHVVGAPTLTLTYQGLGTSRHIYAQLVDNTTGRVLGNLVTPIPVTLDGREHSVTIDMENIAYTMALPTDSLTLQIVDSATAYENFTSIGVVNVSEVGIVLPTAAQAVPTTLPNVAIPPSSGAVAAGVEATLTGASSR
jgi:ABC-2 type transport system ATP-binding protein